MTSAAGLAQHRGRWFVLKIGGELAQDREHLARSVGAAANAFLNAGIKVAIIHGGGPQATALQKRLGIENKMVAGRRFTDEATLEVMKMTVGGQVSVDVASALRIAGVPSICTTGVSSGLVSAVRRPPTTLAGAGPEPVDLGLVGDVASVDVALFEKLASTGVVLVLGSVCGDAKGQAYNVNADTVATRVAARLGAAKLFLISNVPGVLRNKDDPSTRIPILTPAEAKAQIASGAIQGGMIPKVDESLQMLDQGIDAVHIVGVQPEDALLREAREAGSAGTSFQRG
jgi:acetylglutamate kinase